MILRERIVLVTGASSGIGRACAEEFAAAGARLVLTGRDEQALQQVAERTGGTPVVADLAADDGPARLAAAASAVHGRVDVVVLNAGVGWAGPFTEMTPADIDTLLAVNVRAPLHLAQALLPGMVERMSGHLVVVGSIAGALGVPDEAAYSASKAAAMVFLDALRGELQGTGVGTTLVTPGVVDTAFFARRNRGYDRSWPRPVPPATVARRVVRTVARGGGEVVVPGWLRVPLLLHGAAPSLYGALARRFG